LIERTFTVGESEMPAVSRRSKEIAHEQFPEVAWEHSHVVIDADGTVRTYCVYAAPDAEQVAAHAIALGKHTYVVYEIAGDVTPADFPLESEQLVS